MKNFLALFLFILTVVQPQIGWNQTGLVTEVLKPRIRILPLLPEKQIIQTNDLWAFFQEILILDPEKYDSAPKIVALEKNRLNSSVGQLVYVKGDFKENLSLYTVYRGGKQYYDPEHPEQFLGFEAFSVGKVRYISKFEDIYTFEIVESESDVTNDLRIMPVEPISLPYLLEVPVPTTPLEGRILSVKDSLKSLGKYQIAVMGVGARNGVELGELFTVIQDRPDVKFRLPDFKIGKILVYKVYDKLSLGLVLESNQEIEVLDRIKRDI